jgi:hypothetical protein
VFVLCVLYSKGQKAKSQDNQVNEVRIKYNERERKINSRWGRIFSRLTRPDQPWGSPSLLYNGCRGVALTTHPDLAPRLKNE